MAILIFSCDLCLRLQDYTAKLSDFGLAKAGPQGDETHVSTRVMGTYGYAAPEYVMTGMLSYMMLAELLLLASGQSNFWILSELFSKCFRCQILEAES